VKATIKEMLEVDLKRKIRLNKDYYDRKSRELEKNRSTPKCTETDYLLGTKALNAIKTKIAQLEHELQSIQ